MQNVVIIRLEGGRLVWYPPGAADGASELHSEEARTRLRAMLGGGRLQACFAAPGADVRLLQLPVTAAEKKHVHRSLPFMLEEQVAADIEQLHFAYCPLDNDTLAVAVCSDEAMQRWQAQLADLPAPRQWLPEPLLLPCRDGEWCLVLEAGGAVLRTGPCAGMSVERELLGPVLEAALAEGRAPDSVVVYGADQVADRALLPTALQDRVQWRRGDLYAALLLSDGGRGAVNLLQGRYAPRLPLHRWWRQWRAVAALFAVAVTLQLVAVYADYRGLSRENLALRGAVEDSYRRAYPRGAVVDAEKQLRRQLEALRGSGGSTGFIHLMEQVGAVVAGRPGTRIASINYNDKGGEMRMNIIAANYQAVEQVRLAINAAGLEAVMESSSAQGDRVRARLRVGERS